MAGFADAQYVVGVLEAPTNATSSDVWDRDQDFDDRLGRKTLSRRRTDVLDAPDGAAKRSDSRVLALETCGPCRVPLRPASPDPAPVAR